MAHHRNLETALERYAGTRWKDLDDTPLGGVAERIEAELEPDEEILRLAVYTDVGQRFLPPGLLVVTATRLLFRYGHAFTIKIADLPLRDLEGVGFSRRFWTLFMTRELFVEHAGTRYCFELGAEENERMCGLIAALLRQHVP